MFKKIKEYFVNKKAVMAQLAKGEKMKKYHEKLKCGQLFLEWIYEEQTRNAKNINRAERRRFYKDLSEKGRFSKEIVIRFAPHIDAILLHIEEGMQRYKKTQVSKLVQKELKKIKLAEAKK